MQVMPLVAFNRGRLQNFPLLHRQQQFLFGIPPPAAGAALPEETDA